MTSSPAVLLWVLGDVAMIAFLARVFGHEIRSDERDARRIERDLDCRYGSGLTMPAPWRR